MIYKHTQPGTLLIIVLGGLTMLVFLFAPIPSPTMFYSVILLLVLSLMLFYSLTVEVTPADVRIAFGIGLITKRFGTKEIRQVRAVKILWYYGWGIRWIFDGWLYNVSGTDAVELIMADGKKYLIGTDEPEQLTRAILSVTAIQR